jgi:cytochrome c biogenesis protein CcmG/thiol:disulfide interchange protein DsbE
VLVNVWASWCDPCREESPALQRFYEEHRDDGFVVLGIDSRDVSSDAREFVAEYDLTYPQLHDGEGERPDELGMTGFPESFLVDPNGEIALVRPGALDETYLEDQVEPLIRGS